MPHDPAVEQVIEEWAAAVARLYENITVPPDPADERAASKA
jgi:hypothetical protein